MTIKIGKSSISISVEGCFRCGTRWSSGWFPARTVPVTLDGRSMDITLHVCNECASPEEKGVSQSGSGKKIQMRFE